MLGLAGLVFGVVDEPGAPWADSGRAASCALLEAAAPLLPDNTGGALLLGVDGVCVISHGSSSATAIVNAVRVARDCVPAAWSIARPTPRAARPGAMPAETHSHLGPVDRRRDRADRARAARRDPRASTPTRSRLDTRLRDDLDADDFAVHRSRRGRRGRARRTHGRARDRRRRSRRAANRPRRGRLRARRALRRGETGRDRARPSASRRRRPTALGRTLEASLGVRFDRSHAPARARSRTVRGARRTASRSRTNASSSSATRCSASSSRTTCSRTSRACPRASSRRYARVSSTRACSPRSRSSSISARICCSARAKTRPAAARSSRSSPTRSRRSSPRCISTRVSPSRAISCCGACASRITEAAAGPGGRDYKTRLQELTAARCARPAPLRRARRGPRSREALLRRGLRRRRSSVRRRRGPVEEASRTGGGLGRLDVADCQTRGGRAGGRTMPELPEVEVMRRDLERRSSARRSNPSRSPARARCAGTRTRRSSSTLLERPQDRLGAAPRASTSSSGSTIPTHSSCTSACRASCCARSRHARRRRSTRTW